jgi:FKBP-type peptidyl-prolyl cis-trans isomerase
MKQSPWKTMACLGLATSAVLLLSACEDKTATGTNNATSANAVGGFQAGGLQIEDVREGSGEIARKGNRVSVNYKGTLASNGQTFDSSYDRNQPFEFKLGSGQVIEGWEKGIVGMKEGGKRILTIPPEQAYGPNGYPPVIPPNATLKFEVELLDVQ